MKIIPRRASIETINEEESVKNSPSKNGYVVENYSPD